MRYLRCNFFTPFTRAFSLSFTQQLQLQVFFYRLIKMRMNIIIVVRPNDRENLLWTAFLIPFLCGVRFIFCLCISPKINKLIMQLPHNFKRRFLFWAIILYAYSLNYVSSGFSTQILRISHSTMVDDSHFFQIRASEELHAGQYSKNCSQEDHILRS